MNYKNILYSTYVTTHTRNLYGETTIEKIKKQFKVWKSYFGKYLPNDPNAMILDIGCGNGGFVYFLQNIGYKNSYGIDISREQVEDGRKLGIQNIECADLIEFLKEKDKIYNVIFARDVIEHFKKDEILNILEVIFNALTQKGILIIQTPNAESPFGNRYRYGDFTHEVAFTRSSLNQILRNAGFSEVIFRSAQPVPKGIKSSIRFLLWKLIHYLLKYYMLIETGSGEGIFTQNIIAIAKK